MLRPYNLGTLTFLFYTPKAKREEAMKAPSRPGGARNLAYARP